MGIQYLKKAVKTASTDDTKTRDIVQNLLSELEKSKEDGCKVIFSGLGSEEIFAGYDRHKLSHDINKECLYGLIKIYERDLYRDDVITMYSNLELRLPFLDKKLVSYALNISPKLKIKDVSDLFLNSEDLKVSVVP